MLSLISNITDWDIQALIDNQLDWEREKIVRKIIFENPSFTKRYNELMMQKKSIQNWYKE